MKYKVYLSSTIDDLTEERSEIRAALDSLKKTLDGFSFYFSDNATSKDHSFEELLSSDLLISVIAYKYKDFDWREDKARIEYEYEYASQKSIPQLVFFKSEDSPIFPKNFDKPEELNKLNNLRKNITQKTGNETYGTSTDLRQKIEHAVKKKYEQNKEICEKDNSDIDCFVIMSFTESPSITKDTYIFGIKECVENNFKIKCRRMDEVQHNRKITDMIIEQIKNSKFVIADLTDARPNCYYELGYAHSLQRPVIHLIKKGQMVQFDVRDWQFIEYESIDDLRTKLIFNIKETIRLK